MVDFFSNVYTVLPIQRVTGILSADIMQLGREADHSHPSSPEVKNEWSATSSPHMSSWCVEGQLHNYSTATFIFHAQFLQLVHR
jgi:hypothetical protein